MKIRFLFLFTLLFFFFGNIYAAPTYYRKHIVLVVDQTPKTAKGGYLKPIGDALLAFLEGRDVKTNIKDLPEEFSYDSSLDLLEVFIYGLEGNVASFPLTGKAYDLYLASRSTKPNNELFDNTIKNLVHSYKSAIGFGDLRSWWNIELKDVFNASTSLSREIQQNGGYGLSAFLPNAVIPFVDKKIPAQEYYIIYVSTFQAGTSGNNVHYDLDILKQIYGSEEKASEFNNWLGDIASPYQVSNLLTISQGSVTNLGVSAIGKQFVLKSAARTSVNITSNINLEQKQYGGKIFKVSPIKVSFPKDDNLEIKDIILEITNGEEVYTESVTNYTYSDDKKEYTLTPNDICFSKDVDDDGDLKFNIIFTPVNDVNSDVLPFVFTASRLLSVKSDVVFKSAPTLAYIMILLVLILALLIIFWIYRYRAKYAKSTISLNIWSISNSRFMDVSDNKVMNYDCWYFRPGDRDKHIPVTGVVKTVYPMFAAKNKLVVEYMIQDIDMNEDFSFRPDGTMPNGDNRRPKEWYKLTLDEEGLYEFDIISYLDSRCNQPDYARKDKNVLRLLVTIRTHFERNNKIVGEYHQVEKQYSFIVRPAIENSDIWVALDPGTSGSCIAYGWGGLPADVNNIHLACNQITDTAGELRESPIFYSKIRIDDNSALFDGTSVENLDVYDSETGTGDFRFGNSAHILWGRNSFQSIKKLLGYTNEFEVKNNRGKVVKISGEDLAHLLIKGLCREFELYIQRNNDVAPYVKEHLLTDGHLTPSRAIVAVPNNYTVNKVQAMVNTIKRTSLFKEVHFLFEAEGVMMYYLNQNWSRLSEMTKKTFIVFDMGGATINATSFQLDVTVGVNNGSTYIRRIALDTVSRVGYTVGGDNIDFALIKTILNIPSVKQSIEQTRQSVTDFMSKRKKCLITFAQRLKFDYIEVCVGQSVREDNWAKNETTLWTQIYKLCTECNLSCPEEITDKDTKYLNSNRIHSVMKKLVMECVEDAVKELHTDKFTSDILLILSGRSVLYPGIKDRVIQTLQGRGCNVEEWDYNGIKDKSEIVKTAVVRGACWYAMNSKYVEMRHDTVTSTFGFMDQVNNEVKFIPVISKDTKFDENGEIENTIKPTDPTIGTVKFIQMLGAEFDKIYKDKNLQHKKVELTQVPQTDIRGQIKSIKIKVDSNNNFSYEILVAGDTKPICGTCVASNADITDTNSEAYTFAALSSPDEEISEPIVMRRPTSRRTRF